MKKTSQCYLCGGTNTNDFFQLPEVPTQDGVMCDSRKEALNALKGKILLRFCKDCGYLGNEGHDDDKINFDKYDFSNDHSPIFAEFVKNLSQRLIAKYQLQEKTILDVGCGDGYFLKTICEIGNNQGVGIDPGFDFSDTKCKNKVTFLREYYSKKHSYLSPDLVASRHVISVINDPIKLVSTIRKNLENHPDAILYLDAPNAEYTFEKNVIWNVVYENRSWFTKASLRFFLESLGFEVLKIDLCWNNEYISAEAKPKKDFDTSKTDNLRIATMEKLLQNFNQAFLEIKAGYEQKMNAIKRENKKVIAWGAGARGVSFFNHFDLKKEVPYIIDINEKRQNKFLPGSGQAIVAPKFIAEFEPDLVIITNPTYAEEIKNHTWSFGVQPEFWVL